MLINADQGFSTLCHESLTQCVPACSNNLNNGNSTYFERFGRSLQKESIYRCDSMHIEVSCANGP